MGAAHELGHLLLHHDADPGSQVLEREVAALAAESSPHAPGRRTVTLARLRTRTPLGHSLKALVYRGDAARRRRQQDQQPATRHRVSATAEQSGMVTESGWLAMAAA
ncbi:hypothetical protein KBX50_20215 [Micromonospora sp. C51]|uniref:hypothetical protein n=1 Tax=Micromonospora sp. C51 TaxID=2824879 RepID=UPI001B368A42|nr:hypothetical protein [Micromonospora sp. C51]MBQ1050786.1 hypothetical protein [Micromonospora sp. C51]